MPTQDSLMLGAIAIAGTLLRMPSLGTSVFGDEPSSYFIVMQHSLGGIVRLLDGHSACPRSSA